ncbi:SURF1 family protein [Loktanella sp. M215]|uniref:SURF1 family protein n=1 Tax=Loktanella sp. M215 TaxID=2675431 RepID=UPI001F3AFB3A|nr:SURF1 family protein [Loktanella sp. M215]MCF7701260.1 SURF1 family protein [Loktanella sp. M215]
MSLPPDVTPRTRRSRTGFWLIMGLGVLLVALFCALGVWQVERLAWKRDLIATVDARLAAPAAPAPAPAAWPQINQTDDRYRKVTVTGQFRHDAEVLVQAVTELGGGFWVMTPLVTPDGTWLINRGFVPADRRDPGTRAAGQIDGTVTVTGLMRMTEPDGAFLRANAPDEGRWYSRDVAAIADRTGLALAPAFIDADATPNPGGLPVGGLTVVAFRNSHLSYALTWFALALGTIAGLVILVRQDRAHGLARP